jgi:hypothetical protein
MRAASMKAVVARVRKLEDRYGAAINARRQQDGRSGTDVLKGILARFGIVREGNESLAETAARAMGISAQQLRAELQQRAFGGPR